MDRAGQATAQRQDRNETPTEAADRNFAELLQELRVLQTGVQILFGFLLIMAVQPRMQQASTFTRTVYITTLALSCLATVLLMGPAAYHRVLFGTGHKREVVRGSHRLAHGGIVALLLAISSAILLVTDLVLDRATAWVFASAVVVVFVTVWFVLPAIRGRPSRSDCRENGRGPA